MRRTLLATLVAAAAAVPAVGPVSAAEKPHTSPNSLGLTASYEVKADFGWDDRRATVQTKATVANNTRWSVDELAFNLATLRTGRASVDTVTVDGTAVDAATNDQTIIVPLSDALAPNEQVEVQIDYRGRLNASANAEGDDWEFARIGEYLTAYRWIPWLSRPTRFNRPNVGDPWVTAMSPSVSVELTTDRDVTYATSGRRTGQSSQAQSFSAIDVRDFNFVASPSFVVRSTSAAGIDITLYSRTLPADTVLDVARRSLRDFAGKIGRYPHDQLTIAETGPWAPFESPAHFWLPSNASNRLLPWMVAHEVAHQWFYSAVGNDQALEPFADEAITDYMARDFINRFVDSTCPTDRLDHSIYDIRDCYAWVVYVQGDAWLRSVRERSGGGRFWNAVSDYYDEYAGGMGGTRELLGALANRLGRSAVDYRRFPYTYPARVVSMPFGPAVP
jgi:hypothetical protein